MDDRPEAAGAQALSPAAKTRLADFVARLFTVPFPELRAVLLAFAAAHDIRHKPTMDEIAADVGARNKQGAKLLIGRAISRVPELRALVPHLSMYFLPADERRLERELAAGRIFPGVLERNRIGVLVSPVRAATAPAVIPPNTKLEEQIAKRREINRKSRLRVRARRAQLGVDRLRGKPFPAP